MSLSAFAIFAASAASAVSGSFDCVIDQIAAVSVDGAKATASPIGGMPKEALQFRMSFKNDNAKIEWPDGPFQITGEQKVLPLAPGAGMVLMLSGGPCMFTDMACATMVSFAQQPDKSLQLMLSPTAVATDKDRGTRSLFLVSMQGHCVAGKIK